MGIKSIKYRVTKQRMGTGKYKGKTILMARATNRQRVSFRRLCEDVSTNTTFAPEELMAAIQMTFGTAKRYVQEGDSVELGDFGTLSPSIKSRAVPIDESTEDERAFNPRTDIERAVVKFAPSRKYFTLEDVHFERVDD